MLTMDLKLEHSDEDYYNLPEDGLEVTKKQQKCCKGVW
jgi:hypothetical protein